MLPGVVSTSDLSATFHVRGGSSDQNLILLDGVPVFSPFHLGGFFSVFNPDMLDRVELQSGGFPAEHGGRVSSVLTVETDPGDGEFAIEGGASLLSTRVAVSGGFPEGLKGRLGLSSARWRGSVRRPYFDVLFKPVFDFPYHLTDLQGAFEGWTVGGDRIELTGYHGRDVLDLRDLSSDFPLRLRWDWGNDVAGASWTRPLQRGGSVGVEASLSSFGSGLGFPDFDDTEIRTDIEQVSIGTGLDLPVTSAARLKLGIDADRLSYSNLFKTGGTVFGGGQGTGWLLASYGQLDWRFGPWLLESGVRLDRWRPAPGLPVTVASPRIAIKRFFWDGQWAVKSAVGRYTQFLHSIRDEELPIGLDVWVLTGARAPHVQSDQVQIGVDGFLSEEWEASLEAYYRSFDGVIAFNPAEDPNDDLDDMLRGDGTSYGADFMLRKDAGVRLNVGTGIPYTRAVGGFAFYQSSLADEGGRFEWAGAENNNDPQSEYAVLLGGRNAERYPTYHRVDLSLRKLYQKSWGTITPHFSLLNVYNRRNVLLYFFEYDRSPPTRSGVSMFPFLPTIGLEMTF